MQQSVKQYIQSLLGTSGAFQLDEPHKTLKFNYPLAPLWPALAGALSLTDWQYQLDVKPHAIKAGLKRHSQVKNVIAIASGKGGVGKSTTAVNLAYALTKAGASVGVLDADIYGPSQPLMLGLQGEQPESGAEKSLIPPLVANGIQSMSMGYLMASDDTPMIWRGPMVSRALQQLFFDTNWQSLDYLIIDLPPGTGDIPLTLVQKLPLSAAVVVTTPQDISLLDAKKAVQMFNKVEVPVLGLIENMSSYHCSECGHVAKLFVEGGGAQMAEEYNVPLLGSLPLDIAIREHTDLGTVETLLETKPELAELYRVISIKMAAHLSLLKKDFSGKFTNIVVE